MFSLIILPAAKMTLGKASVADRRMARNIYNVMIFQGGFEDARKGEISNKSFSMQLRLSMGSKIQAG